MVLALVQIEYEGVTHLFQGSHWRHWWLWHYLPEPRFLDAVPGVRFKACGAVGTNGRIVAGGRLIQCSIRSSGQKSASTRLGIQHFGLLLALSLSSVVALTEAITTTQLYVLMASNTKCTTDLS